MSYKYLIFFDWLKTRLKESLVCIPVSAGLGLLVLFFGNVVLDMNITYIFAWKWLYIIIFGVSTLLSFFYYASRWGTDHMLAQKWNVDAEIVFDALIKLKLLKKEKYKRIKHWTREDFLRHYNISKMVHKVTKGL